jgi:hypothetical protein
VFIPYLLSIFFVQSGRKRIVVAFRGTITRRDFLIDANFQMTSQLNPLADTSHQDPLINLHKGFCGKS